MTESELRGVLAGALNDGFGPEQIADMVATITENRSLAVQPMVALLDGDGIPPIYNRDQVPDGLIDIPSAARKYGCTMPQLRNWVHRGHLQELGRLKAPSNGGGYILVSEDDLVTRLKSPKNLGGRPRKA